LELLFCDGAYVVTPELQHDWSNFVFDSHGVRIFEEVM
jgi:hypothetical protein